MPEGPYGMNPELYERFMAWRESPVPEAQQVKLVDVIGSFQWIYEMLRDGEKTADELQEECEGAFKAVIDKIQEYRRHAVIRGDVLKELNWEAVHEVIEEYYDEHEAHQRWGEST